MLLKIRIVGGPGSPDIEEDPLIFSLELDDVRISGAWLSIWATINFNDTLSSAGSAFSDIHNHITEPALEVHRRALGAEQGAQNGAQ